MIERAIFTFFAALWSLLSIAMAVDGFKAGAVVMAAGAAAFFAGREFTKQ